MKKLKKNGKTLKKNIYKNLIIRFKNNKIYIFYLQRHLNYFYYWYVINYV